MLKGCLRNLEVFQRNIDLRKEIANVIGINIPNSMSRIESCNEYKLIGEMIRLRKHILQYAECIRI